MSPRIVHSTNALPKASNLQEIHTISEALTASSNATLNAFDSALLHASAGNASYLARLIHKYPERFMACSAGEYTSQLAEIMEALPLDNAASLSETELMIALRHAKEQTALCAALLEIAHKNAVMDATRALSEFAQAALSCTLRWLLHKAVKSGDIAPSAGDIEHDCGIIVLGMGKFGAFELNYSSDIDIIILFDPEKLQYTGRKNAQHFMNKLVQELIHIMQERTEHGYVFRTDIRLRPDPSSTPPAVNLAAALAYYETLGQNWERAAMIKARPVAGDIEAGNAFLHALTPYIWRKSLDYAALDDIYSIKRQMHSGSNPHDIHLLGHNVKTGVGGIREIEFFVQTQQLVWGGRTPELRVRGTLDGLAALHSAQLIEQETHDALRTHYLYLRTVEHRLQMHNDAQTHSLPEQEEALEHVACFMGMENAAFKQKTEATLHDVHRIYQASMQDSTPLGHEGKLVFTGVDADTDTLRNLERMGFGEPERIWHIIQLWHRGNRRATKTPRSRRELTEITPLILQTLADTTAPDKAFTQFDDFLSKLPAGVQIFSLLHAHPYLMQIIADILGSAPALGATLGGNPLLLDAVLDADFFAPLPAQKELGEQLSQRLSVQTDIEQSMIFLRVFHNEKRFQAGMHMLKHLASPAQVSLFLSDLAQVILQHTMQLVLQDYGRGAETFPISILALGKLGAREMTFNSDLDIMFLYDDQGDTDSELRTHMHRISQRIINALTLMMREGRLYEVDTRLRPGGADGPIATSLSALDDYFTHSAWTFEHMALTKARIVASTNDDITAETKRCVQKHLSKPRDIAELAKDVTDMRARLHKQFGTQNPYDVKYIDGGLIDIDFFAQSLVLAHAHAHPKLCKHSTALMLEEAYQAKLLSRETVTAMKESAFFLNDALSIQRLCVEGGLLTQKSPASHTRTLAKALGINDTETLVTKLRWHQQRISDMIAANIHLINGV